MSKTPLPSRRDNSATARSWVLFAKPLGMRMRIMNLPGVGLRKNTPIHFNNSFSSRRERCSAASFNDLRKVLENAQAVAVHRGFVAFNDIRARQELAQALSVPPLPKYIRSRGSRPPSKSTRNVPKRAPSERQQFRESPPSRQAMRILSEERTANAKAAGARENKR